MAREFPRTVLEFEHWFRTEEACEEYLAGLRWPTGFTCSRCGHFKAWHRSRGLRKCSNCSAEISVAARTVFHRSKIPLRTWFRAMWWVTNQKSGINALGLQRLLGLGSYQTAWTLLHKLRRAMVRTQRELLSGEVEVDETLIGGLSKGDQSRDRKNVVIIAAEVRGRGIGRIRLESLKNDRMGHIIGFVRKTIAPASEIISDGSWAYRRLTELGYRHSRTVLHNKGREAPSVALPRVHRIASLLKRWLLGTYQGRPSRKQLQHYLAEFTFRFNRRKSPTRGMLFFRLAQQCVGREPTPYRSLVGTL